MSFYEKNKISFEDAFIHQTSLSSDRDKIQNKEKFSKKKLRKKILVSILFSQVNKKW